MGKLKHQPLQFLLIRTLCSLDRRRRLHRTAAAPLEATEYTWFFKTNAPPLP